MKQWRNDHAVYQRRTTKNHRTLGESCNLSESDIRQGVFNYVITRLAIELIGNPKYSKINDVVGAMECCKLELYRRMAANYEDKKASENGDVYNT